MTMFTGRFHTPRASHHSPEASTATRHGGSFAKTLSARSACSGVCRPTRSTPSGSAFFTFSSATRGLDFPPTERITVTLPWKSLRAIASPPNQLSVAGGLGITQPTFAWRASRSALSSFS